MDALLIGRSGTLTVHVHEDPYALAEAGWDDIVHSAGAPVFYRTAYLRAYHQAPLAAISRFGYLVVTDRSVSLPVAVVPVALQTESDPLRGLRLIHAGIEDDPALLSHVWHCYDSRIVGAAYRVDVAVAVVDAMRELAARWGARWFGFVNVERGGSTARSLDAAGLAGARLIDRFTADLSGVSDFAAYLGRLGVRPRANLTRTARRAADTGMSASVHAVTDCDLTEVAELCARTASRFGNSNFYPPETFAKFVTSLGRLAHVLTIRQHGRLVATGVCLTDDQRFHTWTCGIDYDVAGNASPYAMLFAQSVALAIELGRSVLEGGRSNGVFKVRHGLSPCPLDAHVARV